MYVNFQNNCIVFEPMDCALTLRIHQAKTPQNPTTAIAIVQRKKHFSGNPFVNRDKYCHQIIANIIQPIITRQSQHTVIKNYLIRKNLCIYL